MYSTSKADSNSGDLSNSEALLTNNGNDSNGHITSHGGGAVGTSGGGGGDSNTGSAVSNSHSLHHQQQQQQHAQAQYLSMLHQHHHQQQQLYSAQTMARGINSTGHNMEAGSPYEFGMSTLPAGSMHHPNNNNSNSNAAGNNGPLLSMDPSGQLLVSTGHSGNQGMYFAHPSGTANAHLMLAAGGGGGGAGGGHLSASTPMLLDHQAFLAHQQHLQQQHLLQQHQLQHLHQQQQQQQQPHNNNNGVVYFDRCPVICSVLTLFCCPLTLCCSFAALLYSICSYVDYKVNDLAGFRRKSSASRCLIIASCIFSLVMCISFAVMAYFNHLQITIVVRDFINYVSGQG